MAKKAIRLAKVNNHKYSGENVFFATKHLKEIALKPLLAQLDLNCIPIEVDTDQFGTFSGEVERTSGVRETLRLKIQAAIKMRPEARFFLASEGSFGPHPFIGFIPSDHEALLLFDKKLNIEIYVEEVSTKTNHAEIEFGPSDDLDGFLSQIGFPEHGIIVKPKGNSTKVFKNLKTLHEVQQAVLNSFQESSEPKIILLTDMRAHFNPTRMDVIKKAGEKLIESLCSFCPSCHAPGFSISRSVAGLCCEECGLPTSIAKDVIWSCVKCEYTEQKKRPDGLRSVSASNCDFCNP